MSRVLVVAAHPDDEVLGVAGTIAKHVKKQDECYALILGEGITARGEKRALFDGKEQESLQKDAKTSANVIGYKDIVFEGLPDVRFDGLELLDIVKIVQRHFFRLKPDIVYTHHYGDLNIDHRLTYEAVLCACRPVTGWYPDELLCFETPSSTEWNFGRKEQSFFPNIFVDITDTLEKKLEAMKCYRSEIREYPHPRSIEALKAISMKWGSTVNVKYAEAFEQIYKIC